MAFSILLPFCFLVAINAIHFVEQPETQHVLIGNQANFTCRVDHATKVIWHAIFPNRTRMSSRDNGFDSREDISLLTLPPTSNININTVLTVDALWNWNNTNFSCVAEYHLSTIASSTTATLVIYTSLRK